MQFFSNRRKSEQDDEPASPAINPHDVEPPVTPHPKLSMSFATVLDVNTTVEGTLQCQGNLRLDGKFSGTLKITGNVLVGDDADIEADINANNISIAGTVRGNVSGKKVQLLHTAVVNGDITAESLATEEGALIEGKISMSRPDPSGDKPESHDDIDGPTIMPQRLPPAEDEELIISSDEVEIPQDTDDDD